MDTETSIFRSAKSFFAGTLLSRIMGMTRDIVMAVCFGSAPEVAAFMVAYRLANLFRRLLGEGNLQGGFVPQFESLRKESNVSAVLFYRDLFYSIILVLVLLVGLGSAVCAGIGAVLHSDIIWMMILMMPGVVFLCLYALNSSVLQCQKKYFLPAIAPVAFNLGWIAAALFLQGQNLHHAMFGLSLGILGAFILQWWVTSRPVMKWARQTIGWREWFCPRPFSTEVKVLLKPLSFGIVGIGAAQINSAVDAIFARLADPSGPAYLWYAIRIQQLPLALFGITLAGALLPPLSRAIQFESLERYRELLQSGIKKSAALIIPSAVGMFVLAIPGLDLLYGHGGFVRSDVDETGICLQAYAIGLLPMVYVLLLANGFYAKKEYDYPMRCSLISVGCNVLLNALFVFCFQWKAVSIALATALSAILNCWMLYRGLQGRIGAISLWRGNERVFLCSAAAGCAVFLIDPRLSHEREMVTQVCRMMATLGTFLVVLIGLAIAVKEREILAFMPNVIQKSILGLDRKISRFNDSK